jgi:hypothetical protein
LEKLTCNQIDDLGTVLWLSMFNHVLRHVVSILVLNERKRASMQFFENRSLGGLVAVFQHTLNDTAAVWMHRKRLDLTFECLNYELYVFGRNPLDRFLNHMIAVLIFHTLENMTIKLFDQSGLLFGQDVLECLSNISGFNRVALIE